jgi:hypothetical protein
MIKAIAPIMWPHVILFIPILAVLSSVDRKLAGLCVYVQRKIKGKINQKQKKFKLSVAFLV